VVGSLAIFGIADPGFIKGAWLRFDVRVICQVLVQVVLLGSFLTARGSRQSSLIALGELERAVRSVAQRQALLDEAREELRRALGTGRGRFTGQQIGRYRLGEVIGRGAMGEVYASVDPAGEPVAVKMLSQASLGNPHHVQRFLRELRTAMSIDSTNVVRVFEVGEEPLPYLVMERLTGSDLASLLRDARVLPHERVIDLVRQVGAGIAAAGAAGIIHRDLKPQNLMLAGETWKVLDFGVARLGDAGDTLTSGPRSLIERSPGTRRTPAGSRPTCCTAWRTPRHGARERWRRCRATSTSRSRSALPRIRAIGSSPRPSSQTRSRRRSHRPSTCRRGRVATG
jgi:serine/threonine protein kinase